ncbi:MULTISPECIES: MATE family efflux transporter [Rhizobium/Agrobacterium group]|uniref:MATE family efflux transporter n=1 Tax=Rhizobium/Agrobacterium group TaxID=227290 RepID=UPI0015737AF9|nr:MULTISPECIES: MATE family efflux transporter [Rhizobium/Agrobacterium group]NTC82550.1 MATE family efflux transporter [Agrobacterium tumefaciens]NTD11373.1 MATE family efflux transporter [Agrobacterium tumefaciens]NTD88311.1 MATE family efflux transporter [Agrobacterium tumefaciens]NTD92620.1 MATE family efflux transporter [Agrobacterium tumefaciens]NTE00949.1 MATE family efflux transporter [Agrobacterium tumefaciens]
MTTAIPVDDEISVINPRIRRMLTDPILPMLVRLAWPNVLIMLAQASTGLIETWWVAHLGTDALAGMALVFPAVMLMQMMAAGAFGGGISSAISRALGAGRNLDADQLATHAVVINVVLGLFFTAVMLLFGRPIYQALGGKGAELEAALVYSDVVFSGMIFVWLMNGLASIVRGTGNMLFPAIVTCLGAVLLVPVSPLLIFGFGPIPAMGIAGGGLALLLYSFGGTVVLGCYILSGRNAVRFGRGPLRWPGFRDIVKLGSMSSINSVLTNVTIGVATALVAANGVEAVAGFGTAARLEYLLIPVIFGIGAPMVALVGTNIGAGQRDRAIRIAFTGAALSFVITEIIGITAAVFPVEWMSLFSEEHGAIDAGVDYLRIVGPVYGFFGLGLSLYFASQGAGKLLWPLCCGFLRLAIAALGGWLALTITGTLAGLYFAMAAALVIYSTVFAFAIRSGVWFQQAPR